MEMDRTTYKNKLAIQKLGQFVSVKQNIDKEGKKTGKKYKVSLLPTLMVLDGNGKVVLKTEGALDAKRIASIAALRVAKLGTDFEYGFERGVCGQKFGMNAEPTRAIYRAAHDIFV